MGEPPAGADARHARTALLLGEAAMRRLRGARVLVVGLGAVGSYAVEALARAGIGELRIADFDLVRPSNINRQLLALDSTIGQPKTEAAERRIRDINPGCRVRAHRVFADADTLPVLLADPPDVVLDAIDSLSPKVRLLAAAVRSGAHTLSCMGAATRTEPSLIRVEDIGRTRECPLARFVRKRLRAEGIERGIRCVYSLEPPGAPPAPVPREGSGDDPCRRGRPRPPLGSLPTVTGLFGLVAAHEAIRHLCGGFPSAAQGAARERRP